ncbi:hypothetical protein, partial [Streptomyces anthocyanicus]|uniref:hypothetical protein n=1 Tax=Streptomyces anthocyanicus TaxID=68174 RepID=UPI002244F39F
GAEGHKAPLGIPGGIPRPGIRLAANSLCVYAGPLTRPLVWRVNLPGGKFRVVCVGGSVFCLAAKFLFFVFVGPLARPFLGFWFLVLWVVGALVRSGLLTDC